MALIESIILSLVAFLSEHPPAALELLVFRNRTCDYFEELPQDSKVFHFILFSCVGISYFFFNLGIDVQPSTAKGANFYIL